MKPLSKINFSNPRLIIAITIIAVTWVNFNIVLWQKKDVIRSDVGFYYSYLPSAFYYKDLSLQFLNEPSNKHLVDAFYYPNVAPNGNFVIKSTMGMSITYLPFFIGAHYYAKLTGEPTDGYSEPYQFAIQFSSLFYFIFGLIFLIRILRLHFPDSVVSLSLVLLIFGTNVFYYLTAGAGMSHITSFGLACCFIYYTFKWHRQATLKNTIIIGLTLGLLTLIRPVNIGLSLFLFLYGVRNLSDLKKNLNYFYSHFSHLILIALLGILLFVPQLLYWKHQTGSYFFNSYVGEHFFFNRPQIIKGLFSFRKGWLVYTPIMLFSLIGFYYLYRQWRQLFYPVLLLTLVYIYVVFSWWCWWYGGSFGQRALIDIYPFLAVPLAAFVFRVQNAAPFKRKLIYALFTLLILLSLFQGTQARWNIIHYDSMTKEAYFDAFLKINENPEREKFLKHPDIEKAKAGIKEY